MYFDAGPARLAYHHQGILSYCRELGVPIEVMVNDNRAAYLQDDAAFNGKPQSARAVINDARGFVAELAAKAVQQDLLDMPVSNDDKAKVKEGLLAFLRAFGDLNEVSEYRSSARSGYLVLPGAGIETGTLRDPLDLLQLLSSDFWVGPVYKMHFGELFGQSATMLQPVGGMDRISKAFSRELAPSIRYDAQVTGIWKTSKGARVVWKGREKGGPSHAIEAPYVVCTIPLPVLGKIQNNFDADIRTAITSVRYRPAAKIAFQADRRFWELDSHIYGGVSWTRRDITQIWYPTAGIHKRKGILLGGYMWDHSTGETFAKKAPNQRIRDAIADGEYLHPNYRSSLVKGVGVAWPKIPFSEGAWVDWTEDARRNHYPVLLKGDGPILFAGEHMSYLNAWQEGAVLSAHHTVKEIAKRVRARKT
jgi:monoamine oxidase